VAEIDRLLPAYEFAESHSILIEAPPKRVFAALREPKGSELPLTRLLFAIRGLPSRLTGRRGRRVEGEKPLWDQLLAAGFTVLAERPGEEIVLGIIDQFWKLRGGASQRIESAEDFLAFAEPGYGKAVMDFRLMPEDGGTRLWTTTRVHVTDPASRKRFGRYWRVIRPGSGLIRRSLLRAFKRRAERGQES
jgi:uncharacterized protein YndB with AHSA1/START domain